MADERPVADSADATARQTVKDEETTALYSHVHSAVPAIVIIDRINKQSNIGGIVRSASAFGINHICFIGAVRDGSRRSHVDQHSNKPARVPYHYMTAAQLNACFHGKPITFSRFPEFASCRAILRSLSYTLIAIEISPSSTPSHTFHYPPRAAFVAGNETLGVPQYVLEQCDAVVHVEQWGGQQSSLNVAVASAVVMSDYMRQNGGQPGARRGNKFVEHETTMRQQTQAEHTNDSESGAESVADHS